MGEKFDFEEKKVVNEIKDKKAKLVLLQLPEGLKKEAVRLVNYFEKETNAEVVVSGETCWGGCDLALDEAKSLGADLLVHYGHAPFIKKADFPVFYIEIKDNIPMFPFLQKAIKALEKFEKLGLVCSVQHVHQLEDVKNFLENKGKEVVIPKKKGYSYYDGHVVGCDYNSLKAVANDVDAFVVIGNRFHSLGAALSVKNPVYLLDVYNNEVLDMGRLKDKIIKQRFAAIEKIKNAKKIGIIIGLKPGQKFGSFKAIKKKFENKGKEVVILTMREISNDKLINFYDIEAFVELACPRIAIEDYDKYEKTLVTFRESLCALGEIKWEDLLENGFI